MAEPHYGYDLPLPRAYLDVRPLVSYLSPATPDRDAFRRAFPYLDALRQRIWYSGSAQPEQQYEVVDTGPRFLQNRLDTC